MNAPGPTAEESTKGGGTYPCGDEASGLASDGAAGGSDEAAAAVFGISTGAVTTGACASGDGPMGGASVVSAWDDAASRAGDSAMGLGTDA